MTSGNERITFLAIFPFNRFDFLISFYFHFADGSLEFDVLVDFGWHHFVIVLPGPTEENKFSLYLNGNKVDDRYIKSDSHDTTIPSGSGKIVIGRQYTDRDTQYSDTIFDELIFWNHPLTDDQAKSIYESYKSSNN